MNRPALLLLLTALLGTMILAAPGDARAADKDTDRDAPSRLRTTVKPPPSRKTSKLSGGDLLARFSIFPGFAGGSIRLDHLLAEGSRVDFRDVLHANIVAPSAGLALSARAAGAIWAEIRFQGFDLTGEVSSVDAVTLDGRLLEAEAVSFHSRCLITDVLAFAFPTAVDEYALSLGLGVRYANVFNEIKPESGGPVQSYTDAVFPFFALRGRLALTDFLELEGSLDVSIFAYAYREVVVSTREVTVYVDGYGNPIGEDVDSESERYLLNRHNAFIDLYLGARLKIVDHLHACLGYRFFFLNAEQSGGGLQDDLEWRSNGFEVSLLFQF